MNRTQLKIVSKLTEAIDIVFKEMTKPSFECPVSIVEESRFYDSRISDYEAVYYNPRRITKFIGAVGSYEVEVTIKNTAPDKDSVEHAISKITFQ